MIFGVQPSAIFILIVSTEAGRTRAQYNLEEFGPITDAELEHFRSEAERLYEKTDKAILANFGGTAFGDIAAVPAPWLKHPRGIRDVEEWYISMVTRRDYVYQIAAHGVRDITHHVAIPAEVRRAVITESGRLTRDFRYLVK